MPNKENREILETSIGLRNFLPNYTHGRYISRTICKQLDIFQICPIMDSIFLSRVIIVLTRGTTISM